MEERLFSSALVPSVKREELDFLYVHQELQRRGGTLQLLWEVYRDTHPRGYQYSRFCERYRSCGIRSHRTSSLVPSKSPHLQFHGNFRTIERIGVLGAIDTTQVDFAVQFFLGNTLKPELLKKPR